MASRRGSCVLLASALILLAAALPAEAEAWLQFRGDSAKTGVSSDATAARDKGWVFEAPSQSQLVASAVSDGSQVVVADYGGTVSSLDADDGSLRWAFDTGDIVTATPAIAGNLVVVPTGKRLVCLEVQSGGTSVQAKWAFTSAGRIDSSPTVTGGNVFVGSDDRNLYKIDLANGTALWNFSSSDVVKASPSVVGAVIYFGSYDGFVYALDDGPTNATLKWKYNAQGEIAASAAVSGNRVFAATLNGRVIALNTADGARVWEASLGGVIASSPAVGVDRLFVGGDTLSALDLTTGNSLWNRPLTGYVRGSPAIVRGDVVVGDYGGRVFAFHGNGSIAWSYDTGAAIRTSPAVGQGLAFVGNDEGRLIAVPLAAGDPPVVQNLAPRETYDGVTETFSAVASDPEGKDLFFSWDFGDGSRASGQSARHRYGSSGNYSVTLSVSDGLQSRSVTTTVTVRPFVATVTGGSNPVGGPAAGLSPLVIGGIAAAVALGTFVYFFLRRRSAGPSDPLTSPASAAPAKSRPPAPAAPKRATGPAPPPEHRQQAEIDYYARVYGAQNPPESGKAPARPPRGPAP